MAGIYQFTSGHTLVLSGDCELGGPIQEWTLWGPEFQHDPSEPKGDICYPRGDPEENCHPSDAVGNYDADEDVVARHELASEWIEGPCGGCEHDWGEHNIEYGRGVQCWGDDENCKCRKMPAIPTGVLRPIFGLDRNPAADSSIATETEAT